MYHGVCGRPARLRAAGIRVADIDSRRMVIHVEQHKDGRDRNVVPSLLLLGIVWSYQRRLAVTGEHQEVWGARALGGSRGSQPRQDSQSSPNAVHLGF